MAYRYRFLRFPGGKLKAFTMSYDDGCPEDVRFSETISRYGLKCTFNINGDGLRDGSGVDTETVKRCFLDKGHEIAVHGYWHRAEGTLRPIEGIRDVLECRMEMEKKYGRIIRGMAYPDCGITRFDNGADYATIKNYLTELDIVYARTLGGDNDLFRLPTDWHAWMPTAHHINPKLKGYMKSFLEIGHEVKPYGASRNARLFYLWGHSYEFERNKNWDLLDTICETMAGHDDIWYATNGEIYDYVTAYNSLVYSADGTMVYNPTLMTVWFEVDGVLYTVKSGETITL